MKAQLKVRTNLTVELEAEQQTDLFRLLASALEVFGEAECGKCKSGNLAFRVRTVKATAFFEIVCNDCRAVLSMGVHRTGGTLFPRRHTEVEGRVKQWLPDNGWLKWDPEKEQMV
jgi:hypothetical protein